MVQAADRRQLGATSTPPSLPAPSWRRDLFKDSEETNVTRVSVGGFPVGESAGTGFEPRAPDRAAAIVVLAPFIGALL